MVEVGRDLWTSSGPIPLFKQGHLDQAAPDHVRMASEYLQGCRLHHRSGQPVPALGHPDSKKVFPDVQRAPPVLLFVPTASGPVPGHQCKEPGSILPAPSLQIFIHIDKLPLRLLLSRLNHPSSLTLPS